MQCVDVAEFLLADDLGLDPEVDRHVATCARCSHVASGLKRVEALLHASLVVAPPVDLQRQLAQIALEAARPQVKPWWSRVPELVGQFNLATWVAQRPQMVAAQGLAAVMLALASWQIFGWMSAVQPMIGDVPLAMQLVVASPAAVYLGSIQIDFQTLGIWSLVGLTGWLVSENGPLGRRLTSTRLRLP